MSITVMTTHGIVVGRGATLTQAIHDALTRREYTADQLIAGDNETHTLFTAAEITAEIAASNRADSERARERRIVIVARERTAREDRGEYIDLDD